MRVAVVLLLAACASAQEVSNGPQDKPGYEQTEAPDKQVEYVTGPNVGIVGPTVLGGKGQEALPSGEELQSTDKDQRDVSSQGVVYSGYQELPGAQDESKGQQDAAYAKYVASLNYDGLKYVRKTHKKTQVVKIGSRPTTQRQAAYYQSGEPDIYTQSQGQYYGLQNQEQNRRPQEDMEAQSPGQEEGKGFESQAKSDASNTSQESRPQSAESQHKPPTNEASVYIPQEYLQYRLAPQAQLGQLQFPGKHQLQLFLPQEASGRGQEQHVQNPHHQTIQNGRQIQYIPTYISAQPTTLQKERQSQSPTVQIIRQPHQHVTQHLHNAHLSTNPSFYHSAQPHPQLYSYQLQQSQLHSAQLQQSQLHSAQSQPSQLHLPQLQTSLLQSTQLQSPQLHSNFQPSQHQPSVYPTDPAQYHLIHQSNEVLRQPQNVYIQPKQSTQSIQHIQETLAKPNSPYLQPQGHQIIYRKKSPERLPQRQPEHLSLISPSPPKTTQHRQTHDNPPTHQSEQVYQTESTQSQTTDGQPIQTRPYIQKIQAPLHIQSPTPYPVKVEPGQPQLHIPLPHYELGSDKVALRPLLYPIGGPIGQPVQTEIPQQPLEHIPTEAAKLYDLKIPNYIKALEHQAGESKPFGFSQMSYGQKPGSYSYSIFNKHS